MVKHHLELAIVDENLIALSRQHFGTCCSSIYSIVGPMDNISFFQQDNAHPHAACVVSDFLEQNVVNVLPWPAVSPDLSPIDNVNARGGHMQY